MQQQTLLRATLSTMAVSVLVLGLASCAAPAESTPPPSSQNTSSEKSDPPEGNSGQGNDLGCNWDEPRLIVASDGLPTAQQGELAKILIGTWQFTHYDLGLGDGWKSWDHDHDRRYVFAETAEAVHCVILSSSDSPSELGANYAVADDQITFDNGNAFTAVAWTNDVLLLTNHQDDSLNLFHRR